MKIEKTEFDGLFVIQPKIFEDQRGLFFESYNKLVFTSHGIDVNFVQDNLSYSKKDVLRGLHFQQSPFAQGKLVSVVYGSVLDVVVDLRKNSKTFGKHFKLELSNQNKTMLYIPVGFAHGFLALENNTVFSYKCTNIYNKSSEVCILWNDASLNINWGIEHPIISEKDNQALSFNELNNQF